MVPLGEIDGELPLAFAVYLPVLPHRPTPSSIKPPVDEAAAAGSSIVTVQSVAVSAPANSAVGAAMA